MNERAELSDEAKTFVVQALACWDTPSDVAKAVRDEFGITITRQSIEFYDPTKRAGANLSTEFKALFEATRARFTAETAAVGVAHRTVRLRRLQRFADKAESMGNLGLAAKLLEQAAKEMGDSFSNKVAISGDGQGGPIQHGLTIRFVRPGAAPSRGAGRVSGDIEFPEALDCLFEGARYKVLYGGRGSGKSWGVARALLAIGAQKPTRVLCAREFQNSIEDSVLKLLGDQVDGMGLVPFYEVQKKAIIGANGSSFAFAGLRHNASKLKSFEGVDVVWVEEAHNVSKASWDVLIPTIRKAGSEIWIVFNPELDTDETWKRFVKDPPPEFKDGKRYSYVRKVGWRDNHWFPTELEAERTELQRKDPVAYQTVWEGHCRQTLDGAIYAAELLAATASDRITRVPYDATKPVHTFWDLGWADKTSIWFAQAVGFEYRVIDFLQDSQKTVQHFLTELQGRATSTARTTCPTTPRRRRWRAAAAPSSR